MRRCLVQQLPSTSKYMQRVFIHSSQNCFTYLSNILWVLYFYSKSYIPVHVKCNRYWSFQKCICTAFGAFSTSNYGVNGGTTFCNLWIIFKLRTYLTLITVVVIHSECQTFEIAKYCNTDFVFGFQQRAFLRLWVTRVIKRCSRKLGHDILHYVWKFRHSERDNNNN